MVKRDFFCLFVFKENPAKYAFKYNNMVCSFVEEVWSKTSH